MCIATNEITAPHAPFSLHAMTLPFVSDEETAGIPNLASSFGSNLSRQLDEHLQEGKYDHITASLAPAQPLRPKHVALILSWSQSWSRFCKFV